MVKMLLFLPKMSVSTEIFFSFDPNMVNKLAFENNSKGEKSIFPLWIDQVAAKKHIQQGI